MLCYYYFLVLLSFPVHYSRGTVAMSCGYIVSVCRVAMLWGCIVSVCRVGMPCGYIVSVCRGGLSDMGDLWGYGSAVMHRCIQGCIQD